MRILAIDGGGIRGLIPALVLAELERRAGRPVARLFDLVAGTSTGGILAAGLTLPDPARPGEPRWSAAELAALYLEEGPKIFDRSLLRRVATADGWIEERYDDRGLEAALDRYIGRDARLSDALVPVVITAYDLEARNTFFFTTLESGRPGWDHLLRDAARATSAAPTYFEPLLLEAGDRRFSLVDGGVFATNPAMCAYADARRRFGREPDILVSLGTGKHTRRIPHEQAVGWGTIEWVRPIIDVVFDGVSDSTEDELEWLIGDRHHRFQIDLVDGANDDMDDASPENLDALARRAAAIVDAADETGRLDAVIAKLTA